MALFLITAPSGAGKTSIAHTLRDLNIWAECISHTTRPKRDGEIEGHTYYYISEDKFKEMKFRTEFVEDVVYDNNYYGVSKSEIDRASNENKHVFIIVEYEGYKQIKNTYPDAVGIFLHMSKEDCMANMLLRGDSLENANKRISRYDDEMKNKGEYDYVIKNVRDKVSIVETIIKRIVSLYD